VSARGVVVPPQVRQRFFGYDEHALLSAEHRPFLVGRLLEEANADELRWLVQLVGRDALAQFLTRHGGRQLSQRSRAFWERVLGVESAPASSLARELWPLA